MSAVAGESHFDDNVDFDALLARLVAKRWWIIGIVFLSTAGFSAMAFLTVPVYRATVMLAPSVPDRVADTPGFAASSIGGLVSGLGIGGPRDPATEEALAVLRSRQFTESFFLDKTLIPKLFPRKWNAATGTWRVPEEQRPTPSKAYKYFDERVRSVTQDKKTGLITLQIEWIDRNEAAVWANELVRRLNDEMRARAIAKADASMHFLERELQTTPTAEARVAVSHLMESQVKQRMLADVTQDYSFRVVDKAIASDKDDPVRPRKALLLLAGPSLGIVAGIIFVLVFLPQAPEKPLRASERSVGK